MGFKKLHNLINKYNKTNSYEMMKWGLFGLFIAFMFVVMKNVITHQNVLTGMLYLLGFGMFFVYIWIIKVIFSSNLVRFLTSLVVIFITLSITMFFDGGYVDYTSFIVTGGASVFISGMIVLSIGFNEKLSK